MTLYISVCQKIFCILLFAFPSQTIVRVPGFLFFFWQQGDCIFCFIRSCVQWDFTIQLNVGESKSIFTEMSRKTHSCCHFQLSSTIGYWRWIFWINTVANFVSVVGFLSPRWIFSEELRFLFIQMIACKDFKDIEVCCFPHCCGSCTR